METLGHAYADMHMRMHALDPRMRSSCTRTHTLACVYTLWF